MEDFNEGCLSIPDIREDVSRKDEITIEFLDENFKPQQMQLYGIASRIVQHEYDHIEGILFTDKLSALKKKLLKSKLTQIARGKVEADYPMTFADKKSLII
jgi:peptide deformylase